MSSQAYGQYSQYGGDQNEYGNYDQQETSEFQTYGQEYAAQPDGADYTSYYGSSYGAGLGAETAPLDLQMEDPVAFDAIPQQQPLDAASFLDSFAVAAVASPTADGAPVTPHVDTSSDGSQPVSNDSVHRLSSQFASMGTPTQPSSGGPGGSARKWADPMAKAKAVKPEVTARAADPVDPKAIDTSSANVQDVRKMWQQAAQNAPPPMPKTKLGIVLPAAEASSTVHTTGLMDRSAYARQAQILKSRIYTDLI